MASSIKGYRKATKRFHILAACGVGMAETGTHKEEVRKATGLPDELPLFTLQGGFDIDKLHGIYKWMITLMIRNMKKKQEKKKTLTSQEDEMINVMLNGGSYVSEDHLAAALEWYERI